LSDARLSRNDRSMSIWEHIRELVRRMKAVVITFVVASLVALAMPVDLSFLQNTSFYRTPAILLLDLLLTLKPARLQLLALDITAPLELWVIAAFVLGAMVTLPVFAYELYQFIDPALYPNERKAVYPNLLAFVGLFIAGCLFGYFFLVPVTFIGLMPFFDLIHATPAIGVTDYYSLVGLMIMISGLSFTLPIFFILLVRFHILHTSIITKNRRYVHAGLYVVCALITPDGGPLADLALYLPMAIFLEASVYIAKRYEKEDVEKAKASEAAKAYIAPPPPLRCKYCGHDLVKGNPFCPNCRRSQV
jgi:sec-independent protein translocase protein TatC